MCNSTRVYLHIEYPCEFNKTGVRRWLLASTLDYYVVLDYVLGLRIMDGITQGRIVAENVGELGGLL